MNDDTSKQLLARLDALHLEARRCRILLAYLVFLLFGVVLVACFSIRHELSGAFLVLLLVGIPFAVLPLFPSKSEAPADAPATKEP